MSARERLFGIVMFWTSATTVFTLLPLARIIGRPEGYRWAIGGLSGDGTSGPFWIFIPLLAYVVLMLFAAFRLPRAIFHPMLVLWHLAVIGVVGTVVLESGTDAQIQGQGLHWSFDLWILLIACLVFGALTAIWIVLDRRAVGGPVESRWAPGNTRRVATSLVLLGAALVLFRLGTNYNWVTAAAIVTTIVHWIMLVQAFAFESHGPARPASGS